MKKILIRLVIILPLLSVCAECLVAQQPPPGNTISTLEQQYTEYITGALRFQVRADSLTRAANLKRRELAFSGNDQARERQENSIISLEQESFRAQKQADSLYTQARAIELRLMSESRGQADPNPAAGRQGGSVAGNTGTGSLSDRVNPGFLVLGKHNISSGLTPRELLSARDLDPGYSRANQLMDEVSDIHDEIEQLGRILDTRPRRRERRRVERQIEELTSKSFDMKMEAMVIYRKINALRYSAAVNFLEKRRQQINDSLIINSGLVHEELARVSYRQAAGLRETAVDLRSDKYLEGFILRAYTEELNAFIELERALEIYGTPASPPAATREIPLQADGRIDPGSALSRSRQAAVNTATLKNDVSPDANSLNPPELIDFGFSVFPESPYSAGNPVPARFKLPEGMAYSIQLGIYRTIMNPASFRGLYPVMSEREPDNRSIRYLTGVFRSLPEAEKALLEVNRQGFSDAFIVAYNNGTRMPVSRARQLERNNLSGQEALSRANQSVMQPVPGPGSPAPSPGQVVFKIQLGAFREIVQPAVYRNWQTIAGDKNVEHSRNNNGLNIYSIGNFNTFEDAAGMQNRLGMQGITGTFIVPYNGNIRITMEEAKRLLLRQ
jgi:hypothetical protein